MKKRRKNKSKKCIKKKYQFSKNRASNRNYNDPAYKEFRRLVRERDDCTCQFPGCGKKKSARGIQVHHIIKWHDAPHLRTNVNNGICLCYHCHKRVTGNENAYIKMFMEIVRINTEKWYRE